MPLPRLVRLGLALFVALVVALHGLRPGLPPPDHFVSEYAVGPGGVVMRAAFVVWAASLGAAAVLAARLPSGGRPIARGLVAVAYACAALGTFAAGLFATQTVGGVLPEGVERTATGQAHDTATLVIVLGLFVAALAAARHLRDRALRRDTLLLALALPLSFALLVAVGWDAPGVGQRAWLAIGVLATVRWTVAAQGYLEGHAAEEGGPPLHPAALAGQGAAHLRQDPRLG